MGVGKLGSFSEDSANRELSAAHVRLGDPDQTGLRRTASARLCLRSAQDQRESPSERPCLHRCSGGWDYFSKVVRYALRRYQLNIHVNGMSKKGYLLALVAVLVGKSMFRPTLVTFHGGLAQDYFPRPDSVGPRVAFRLLFLLAGNIACDSPEIKQAIVDCGISPQKVSAIATFSSQYLSFTAAPLSAEIEAFLAAHHPVFFSYAILPARIPFGGLAGRDGEVSQAVSEGRLHLAGLPRKRNAVSS